MQVATLPIMQQKINKNKIQNRNKTGLQIISIKMMMMVLLMQAEDLLVHSSFLKRFQPKNVYFLSLNIKHVIRHALSSSKSKDNKIN